MKDLEGKILSGLCPKPHQEEGHCPSSWIFIPLFRTFRDQAGSATHRALAALIGGGVLLGWLLLVRLIAVADHPGAEGIARLALLGVTLFCLAAAWLLYRWIRHLDPQDDLDNPGWPDMTALWLLERYERLFPGEPVYPDRPRTKSYIHAANRGFHSFLADSIVELERQPADTRPRDADPTDPDQPTTDDPDVMEELFDIRQREETPVDTGSMRLRRRQAVSQTRPDATARPPVPEETETSIPTNQKS
ncbi:MAG: hypothetical protein HQL64_07425 [Magnetococcales bacterium]|nr:hypothetical protein [Magnetococcales bacterium]